MSNTNERLLPHLIESIPRHARGSMVSGYSIALEGWRRGLDLKIKVNYQRKKSKVIHFILGNGQKEHAFTVTRGDLVTEEAVNISDNKEETKKYLERVGVIVPKGKAFDVTDTNKTILDYANSTGYPLVIKPIDGTDGEGVITDIPNETEMRQAINFVREQLKFKNVLVEQFCKGDIHKFYVVGQKVVGVLRRAPISLVGNGENTIQELLKMKNEERWLTGSFETDYITAGTETKALLDEIGYTIESVPKEGEVVFLESNNHATIGEAVDVMDEISDELKQIAVTATVAIPTLVQAGVDIIIDKERKQGTVLEVNSTAPIRPYLFPAYGKARDVASAIIDYYFPETTNYDRADSAKLYFDFDHVFESFQTGNAGYIEIPRIPKKIELTRYQIKGDRFPKQFENWIHTNAVKHFISGYLRRATRRKYSLVIGGSESDMQAFNLLLNREIALQKSIIIEKKVRKTPIKQGFKVIEMPKNQQRENRKLKHENRKMKKELENIYKKQGQSLNNIPGKEKRFLGILKRNK